VEAIRRAELTSFRDDGLDQERLNDHCEGVASAVEALGDGVGPGLVVLSGGSNDSAGIGVAGSNATTGDLVQKRTCSGIDVVQGRYLQIANQINEQSRDIGIQIRQRIVQAFLKVGAIVCVDVVANVAQIIRSNPDCKYLPIIGEIDLGVGLELLDQPLGLTQHIRINSARYGSVEAIPGTGPRANTGRESNGGLTSGKERSQYVGERDKTFVAANGICKSAIFFQGENVGILSAHSCRNAVPHCHHNSDVTRTQVVNIIGVRGRGNRGASSKCWSREIDVWPILKHIGRELIKQFHVCMGESTQERLPLPIHEPQSSHHHHNEEHVPVCHCFRIITTTPSPFA